jgi:glycosyltransferase involved in cell wall biosynthesis
VWKDGLLGALSGFRPHLVMPWGSDILLEPDRSWAIRMAVRYVLRRADMITCDCQVVADKIVQLSGYPRERIVVFPWGVDRRLFHPDVPPTPERRALGWDGNPVLIMNRTFRPLYNVSGFLEAMPRVLERRPDVRVFLLGAGPQEPMLRSLARRLGLEDVVRFVGPVPPEQMATWLRASDLYVSNSFSDGASLSLLEAMSCGLPVVVSDVPALLEWVTDGVNGLVVPRGDSAALARAMVRLVEDDAARGRMGRENRAIAVQRADWAANFRRLEEIYRRLVAP